MICPHCEARMIHTGDEDLEENETFSMVSIHHCPECETEVNVYRPHKLDEVSDD